MIDDLGRTRSTRYFDLTVSSTRESEGRYEVSVEVCLTRIPPGYTEPVPVSTDPWTVTASKGRIKAQPSRGTFAASKLYVDECQVGRISFPTDKASTIHYDDFVGGHLTWDIR